MKNIISRIFSFVILITGLVLIILSLLQKQAEAVTQKTGIENFPESYRPYLEELQKKHPNWTFTALYTDLDYKYVIDNENIYGKNLVPKSYSDRWKNTEPGKYNVEVDAGWVDSSRQAVEYTMDARNFLNEVRIFQFEGLSYNEKTNNKDGIEKILYGTEFYNATVKYLTSTGTTVTMSKKYSDLILSAGVESLVSPYHLASRIKQEVGPFLSHSSISGDVSGYKGLYNFYNIGATSSSEPMGAIKNGLQYAKDGKGASSAIKTKYLIPWNTKEKAITGGAIFIGSSYIHLGQNTIYLQKFHVVDSDGGELFWHQYMTNVLAPYSESYSIYNGYKNSNMLNTAMNFIIPIYNNMPEIPAESPNISPNDYTNDNTKVSANVSTTLNIRTGPSTSYEVITSVAKDTIMTRLKKGKQSGELWDKVQLENGIIGYAFQNYLQEVQEEPEVPEIEVEEINLFIEKNTINKGENIICNAEILPENATNREVIFSTSDSKIATVDSNGNIVGVGAGTATITARSANNKVTKSIQIEVYSPVTDIGIYTTEVTLQVGETFKLEPIIYPSDANNKNVSYLSSNSEIVEVASDGTLTGKKEGIAQITITTEEGNKQKNVDVVVIKKLEGTEIVFDESLNVSNYEISGLDYKNNTVEKIKEKIITNFDIQIYNYNGETLEGEDLVGTGSKIQFLNNNEIVLEYNVILYGDVNGDGKINSVDLLVLQRHILEIKKFDGVFLRAGNINKNGKAPSSVDLLLIQRHILGIKEIEQ